MKRDCCPEPIAGPAIDDRALMYARTSLGPLARGDWPRMMDLGLHARHATLDTLSNVLVGLYIAVDAHGRLRWLGKACRNGGVTQRLREHLSHPERERVFTHVYVAEADPECGTGALGCAEGMAADLLQLRGRLGPRTWPPATDWNHLVAAA